MTKSKENTAIKPKGIEQLKGMDRVDNEHYDDEWKNEVRQTSNAEWICVELKKCDWCSEQGEYDVFIDFVVCEELQRKMLQWEVVEDPDPSTKPHKPID